MKKNEKLKSNDWLAFAILFWQITFTAFSVYLCFSSIGYIKWTGEVLLAINFFQWFVIHHDLAHSGFFKTRVLNDLVGHVSSLFCLIPYFTWKHAHHYHHVWTGWKDKDPSDPLSIIKEPNKLLVKIMNFCWKYWIPVFTISFVIINFWNVKRVNALVNDKKSMIKNYASVVFLVSVFAALFVFIPTFMLTIWLPAFIINLVFSDPILLTQHVHLDANLADGNKVKTIKYIDQKTYARTLIYPKFISTYFFYHSERHGLHHQHPELPIYHLGKLPSPTENNIHWFEWLKRAKSMPADILIFKTSKDSGVKL